MPPRKSSGLVSERSKLKTASLTAPEEEAAVNQGRAPGFLMTRRLGKASPRMLDSFGWLDTGFVLWWGGGLPVEAFLWAGEGVVYGSEKLVGDFNACDVDWEGGA